MSNRTIRAVWICSLTLELVGSSLREEPLACVCKFAELSRWPCFDDWTDQVNSAPRADAEDLGIRGHVEKVFRQDAFSAEVGYR